MLPPDLLATAKLSILVGSLLAVVVGTCAVWLARTDPTRRTTQPAAMGEMALDSVGVPETERIR